MTPLIEPSRLPRMARMAALLLVVAATAMVSPPHVEGGAGGFAIREQSASHAGAVGAGAPALAIDASTVYYNPAGMVNLDRPELVLSNGFLLANTTLKNASSTDVLGNPVVGNDRVHDELFLIPSVFLVWPILPATRLGAGVNTPFGLGTKYDAGWVGRYHVLRSRLETANLTIGFGHELSHWLAVGANFRSQYARARRSTAIDFGAACVQAVGVPPCQALGLFPGTADGRLSLDLDGWALGYDVGAMVRAGSSTRVGLVYHSALRYKLRGTGNFDVPAAAMLLTSSGAFRDTGASTDLTLPESLDLGVVHDLTPRSPSSATSSGRLGADWTS